MNLKESIKQFLPKYLSETEQKKLLAEIKAFPHNIDSRFYTDYLREELVVFQGDGLSGLKSPIFLRKNLLMQNVLSPPTPVIPTWTIKDFLGRD